MSNIQFPLSNKVNNRRGFTLIEMLVYMAILSVLLVVLSQFFGSILNTRRESESFSSVEQDGKYILQRVMYDINRATSITSPAGGAQGSTLQILTAPSTNYYIRQTNNNIEVQTNSGPINQLNSNKSVVSNLNFARKANSIIISFTLTGSTSKNSGLEVRNFQTTVGIR